MAASSAASKMFRPEHGEHLARFRIPSEMFESAGVRSVTDGEAREILGQHGQQGANLSGILFPYLSPLTGARVGGRIRLDHPLPDDGGKYISEQGCRHLFFSPNVADLLSDVTIPGVIVEAEKSALAITALATRAGRKLLVIAIGGCWGWRRKTGKKPESDGSFSDEKGPSPDFDLISWEGRLAILALDSNAATNLDVMEARRALAKELAARGAIVAIAEVPTSEGANGPDDLIAVSGDEGALRILDAARLFAVCAVAEAEQAVAGLEADKMSDPLPAIEGIAAIEDSARRALLIGRLAALKVPGANRKFVEQRVRDHRVKEESDHKKATDACRRGRLMAMAVEGAALLDEICTFIRRFVWLSEAQIRVAALWTVHTHAIGAAECTPYLAVTSAEKRSGKSRLLEVLNTLVAKPWFTGRVTAAVLYRKIDAESPTLLLDESDAAFKSGEEYGEALRGILNTGHRRGGKTTCCVKHGAEMTYQDFSTFSPKAIAGIGKLPDTVADRSIPFCLERKMRSDKVERFRLRDVHPEAERLRERLEAWGCQNIEKLRDARPALPEKLSDRQQDGVEPLVAIADLAGSEWPEASRLALELLCCGMQAADDSIGVLLLSDIRQIFKKRDTDRLPSSELTGALTEIETSPWGEYKSAKPITSIGVAPLLKPFDISPHNIRVKNSILKGYEVGDFEDDWARYLPPEHDPTAPPPCPGSATPLQANTDAVSRGFENATYCQGVVGQKFEKPSKNALCSNVASSEPHKGAGTCEISEEL